jgi:hypothetical protein
MPWLRSGLIIPQTISFFCRQENMTEKYSEAKVLAVSKLLENPQHRLIQDAIQDWLEAKHPQDSEEFKCRDWFKKRSSLFRPGYIYVVEAVGGDGIYKVGRSTNPDRRLTQLPTKAPYELKIESTYPTDAMVWAESQTHEALSMGKQRAGCHEVNYDGDATGEFVAERINGEWFQGWFYKYETVGLSPKQIDKSFCDKNYGSVPLIVELMSDLLHGFSLKKYVGENIKGKVVNKSDVKFCQYTSEDYWYWAEYVEWSMDLTASILSKYELWRADIAKLIEKESLKQYIAA